MLMLFCLDQYAVQFLSCQIVKVFPSLFDYISAKMIVGMKSLG